MIPSRPTSSRNAGHLLILLAGLSLPSAAWGQEAVDKLNRPDPSPTQDRWTVEWAASAEPGFLIDGDRIAQLDPRDVQDEGEYTFAATLKSEFPRLVRVSLSPSATINPNWFDGQDGTSGWSVEAQVRRKFEFPAGAGVSRRPHRAVLPFATYEYGQSFEGIFDGPETADRTVTLGVTFANFVCVAAAAGCVGGPEQEYGITVRYSELDSSNDDNDARGPTVEVDWTRPAFGDTAVWIKASADFRTYDSLSADSGGGLAEAARYSVAMGLDVSGWARRNLRAPDGVEVKIGLRWVRVEADRSDLEREDFAVTPTVSWKH
ncbi:MAG: hypothetical protein QME55_00025 [Brevundimonas sp.]|uniref:hypothetical protein n=1 Tax=Brevundimonas sp. TaxID=1871086 RepID=UPI002625E2CC|nr:hypothetical protein [Brevundimonas sp.]MDI6623089.1 hypothetical protein [Brevundimonas sp.]MDQ7813477.1 hypothetical protein [Brevundimonas sp.]